MRVLICTTPIRPVPTDYPPLGAMAVLQSLEAAGHDPVFYDIDCFRPSLEEAVAAIVAFKPEAIGVSAVVSTAYAHTQRLCLALKKALPDIPLVVGGNLAASAELLHRRCAVDFCVVGEGERTSVALVDALARGPWRTDKERFRSIKGLTFLGADGQVVFTGYPDPLSPEEFRDPDYTWLDRFSRIDNFIGDPFSRPDFARDPRSYAPHRKGMKLGTVTSAKGCVSRCTFCHRWDKGYRPYGAEAVVRKIQYLKDRYNVGFFYFGDENFGSDRANLDELIEALKPLDILYVVGGVRCRSVDPDLLRRMKESGCVALYYGMESGSPDILQVMEKVATLEHNRNAARWTREAGLYTVVQLVLGMPGECPRTIDETLAFVKEVTEPLPEPPHKYLSINYIQALPGTPVYEYGRVRGLIGSSPEAEEAYLMKVSDVDASDDTKFINFTDWDTLTVQSWRFKILYEAEAHWYRRRGWKTRTDVEVQGRRVKERDYYTEGGYFNLKTMMHRPWFFRYVWPVRHLYYYAYPFAKDFVRLPFREFLGILGHWFRCRWRRPTDSAALVSLRRTMKALIPPAATPSEENLGPLRAGR